MKQHPKYPNIKVSESGEVSSNCSNRVLKQTVNESGYHLTYIKDLGKMQRVHRLVCETFLQDSEFFGLDVNHIDGNKSNNQLTNLEWCTRSHNIRHAHSTGLNTCYGEGHPGAVYSEELIHELCLCLQDGWRNKDIASHFNVPKDTVSGIRTGILWERVSSQYSFEVRRNKRSSTSTIHKVCRLLSEGFTPAQVSQKIPTDLMSYQDISRIRNKETWKTISVQYDIPKSSRLTEEEVKSVCLSLSKGHSVRSIVKDQKFSFDQVQKIYKRVSWKGVSKGYEF